MTRVGFHDYEAEARARKVARLVQAIEAYAAVFGLQLDPKAMGRWSAADWRIWAQAACVNVPSETTKQLVIKEVHAKVARQGAA